MRFRLLMGLVVPIAVAAALPAAAATHPSTSASGKWYNAGPCTPVAAVPTPGHPLHADVSCIGSSVWTGTLAGLTDFTMTGHVNLVTDNTDGTVAEVFAGRMGGKTGAMTFHELVHVDGQTHKLYIVAHKVSGSGAFKDAKVDLVFVGTITPATNGFGRYSGTFSL